MAIIIYSEKPGAEITYLDVDLDIAINISQLHDTHLGSAHTGLREILRKLIAIDCDTAELDKLTDLILRLDNWPDRSREQSLIELYVFWNLITLRPWPNMHAEITKILEEHPQLRTQGAEEIHTKATYLERHHVMIALTNP